jgi:hypothetical protein
MTRRRKLATSLGGALLVAAALPLGSQVNAADHRDGAQATDDPLADIADVYAWHTDSGTLVIILTFNGLQEAGTAPAYDSEVLYTINIDNTANPANKAANNPELNDNEADIPIYVKFGQNGLEEWGVQIENLPGSDGTFSGPVEMELPGGGSTRAYAGVFEDPFFFDFEGFTMTRDATVTPDPDGMAPYASDFFFDSTRDSFAGTNVNAIVLEMDLATALGGDTPNPDNYLQIWATAGRLTP